MKYTKNIIGIGVLGLLFMTTACSSEFDAMEEREIMTFRVVHPNASIDSRVTETAFERSEFYENVDKRIVFIFFIWFELSLYFMEIKFIINSL